VAADAGKALGYFVVASSPARLHSALDLQDSVNAIEMSLGTGNGFWERQYRTPSTVPQRLFDLLFGIIAPVLCLWFDPTVFRSDGMMGNGFLSGLRFFGYLEIATSILVLAFYLLTQRASALLAGALWGSFVFAFTLGVVMLPLTLLGLFVVIGIFGFTPFLTSWVFLRNARRCWRGSSPQQRGKVRMLLVTLGMALMLGTPAGLQGSTLYLANGALARIQSGSEPGVGRAVRMLRGMRFFVSPDRIVFAYQKATEQAQRERLAQAFYGVTAKTLEQRLAEMND
jgi:hypothetical protein